MKKIIALILALAMALSLVACGETAKPDGEGGDAAEIRTDMVMQLGAEPSSLDYQQDTSVVTQVMMGNVNACLVTFDANNEIVGELAESWEWNEDYTQITFKLRNDLKFSDGSPLTTKDVIYTFQRGIDLGYSDWFTYIESMEAVDDATLVLNLTQSYAIYLNVLALTFFAVMPEGYAETTDVARGTPVCSGEYYVEAWNAGESITLKANPNYYAGEAAIKDVKFVFIGDENSALVALETGEIDFMQGGGSLSATAVDHINTLDNCTTVANLKETYSFLTLNYSMPELADINVRQAINYAINRDDICTVVGSAIPAGAMPATENIAGFQPGFDAPAQDLAKAKELMAASAYADGFEVEIVSGNAAWTKTATVIQSNLAEIGITVNIRETDVPTVINDLCSGNYQMGICSWGNANADVTNNMAMYAPGNAMCFAQMTDSSISDLLVKSLAATGTERDEILKEAFTAMTDTVAYIGLYWPQSFYGINSALQIDMPIGVQGYTLYSMHWN